MDQLRTPFLLSSVLFLLAAGGCANRPPLINCVPQSVTLTEGETVTIQSNARDLDSNDTLTYNWSAQNGRLSPSNGSAVFDTTGLSPATYIVDLRVTDRKQNAVRCSLDVTVEKNRQAPVVSCDPSTTTVTEGQSTTLRASASDPNNDAITYRWSVDGQSVSNDQASFEFGTTGRSVGTHNVTVTATDSDGLSSSCDFGVTVDRRPNRNPTVALSFDKQSVYAGETINARASATDPDGDPVTYAWTLDNQRRSETSASLSINTSGLSGGRHSASVTVRDDRGASASDTQSFSVQEKIVIQINQIRPDNVAKAQLDEIALKMQQNPQLRALATGHTDDRGSERANERVGQRRADAVKDYLVSQHNIDAGRIETRSAGEGQPVSDNSTAQGRQENRRVEVELSVP
jgi:outer membrane protein OmpA-like peptidoglycan-associated protein